MDWLQQSGAEVSTMLSTHVPGLLQALAILIVGWVAALLISALVSGIASKAKLDQLVSSSMGSDNPLAPVAERLGSLTFYLVMLFVLIGFFQTLGLTLITEPLNQFLSQIFAYAPRIIGGAALLLVGWVIATLLKKGLKMGLDATKLDEKLMSQVDCKKNEGSTEPVSNFSVSSSISEAVYWLVFLLILPSVLSTLGLTSVLEPINNILSEILGYLPNVLSAGVIVVAGWFVARVLQKITTNLLTASGADKLASNVGLTSLATDNGLSKLAGLIVYILVLVPVIIAGLDALAIEAIAAPASLMLSNILNSVPYIFAAVLVVGLATFIGKFVAGLVTNLLTSIGFNNALASMGLGRPAVEETTTSTTPSYVVGKAVMVGIILFASMEAFNLLGFETIATLVAQFIVFLGEIITGLIIFALGLIVSNWAYNAIKDSGSKQARWLALAARVSILVLTGAMALGQMGLAPEIIQLAFGILFGAVAISFALAIGIAVGTGGKPIAERELDGIVQKLKSQ